MTRRAHVAGALANPIERWALLIIRAAALDVPMRHNGWIYADLVADAVIAIGRELR